ncbi:tyrosine-type recombinase/integrase [Nocardia sp. NPDC050435]|uniref:tyrosine-type recombinase/integrase n=1 Tax=Nocardia sp. NPDC050435 TaxID=3155040 RepID=UPI0033CC71BC
MPAIDRGTYFEARYRVSAGRYETIRDAHGKPMRYATKPLALEAIQLAELKLKHQLVDASPSPAVRQAVVATTSASVLLSTSEDEQTFADFVEDWIREQDLAVTTVANYESHIQCHLLPTFGPLPLSQITRKAVVDWEKELRKHGYPAESIRTYRALLHVILADATRAGKITSNPAERPRNRGRRTGRKAHRAPEKVITNALGALLIAERMALLSGRDDEFVATILKFFTGMRLGELRGLEVPYVGLKQLRVEWQLAEVKGTFVKCEPKNESQRDVYLPGFLAQMLSGFIERTNPQPCECHGLVHVFRGQAKRRSRGSSSGITQKMIAERAELSVGTVSAVFRGDPKVPELTRRRVQRTADELGYTAPTTGLDAAHWRRSGFYTWLYTPAVSGWYPRKGERQPARPVPISADSFPGTPVRGRDAHSRSDSCWLALAKDMTPHGLRHSLRTLLEELGTPKVLIDAIMGHEDQTVQAKYTHVTQPMIDRLMGELTSVWLETLDRRLAISAGSPVSVLDGLLRERARDQVAGHVVEIAA